MRLLRQHDVIPAETLRELADEIGVRWSKRFRMLFFIAVACLALVALVTVVVVVADAIKGAGLGIPVPVLVVLPSAWIAPVAVWMEARAARVKRIRRAMLNRRRCPHCGYDIRLLPTDPSDRATVCPECGCAWRLDPSNAAGGQDDG